MTLILFILILGITVCVHEFGHFLFAKIVGIKVYEYSIGMGPAILKSKPKGKDGTIYCLRAIPLGGYVQLAGEEVELDKSKNKGHNLQDKKPWQRFLVMFMGPGFNFVFSLFILVLVGIFFGATSLAPVITKVTANEPAYQAGLRDNDKVLQINNHKITYIDDITLFLTIDDISKQVNFKVKHEDGKIENVTVYPSKEVVEKNGNKETNYHLGIEMDSQKEKGIFAPIKYAVNKAGAIFKQMFVVLKSLFTGKLSIKSLSGPVGIYEVVGQMKNSGIASLLYLLAYISINVGVINLLPFPAFDGGRILFVLIEKIKGSPVNSKVENIIHTVGFVLLIILMLYITFNDILKLF